MVEYVGEMITSEEAEERGKKYDAEGRTYPFDLDFNMGDQNPYNVDAAFYGNASFIVCVDPNMPRLCLFAERNIWPLPPEVLWKDVCVCAPRHKAGCPPASEPPSYFSHSQQGATEDVIGVSVTACIVMLSCCQ